MYGTIARFRLKPGMEEKLLAYSADVKTQNLPGLVAEFTYRSDEDPNIYYEAVVFESREAYRALAESPEQDARYHRLLELLEAAPEWHDGEIINADFRR